ncbi:MAG: Transcriptional regulator [Sphingobacteriales bacterium]|nr:Transcriptional regulator [Sphingobacteriales bacterium]
MYKIGLVEQNEKLRKLLRQVLIEADFEVLELEQSENSIQKDLNKYHPDFLIMDIGIPNDGLVQTCNAIKLHKSTKYIPLIVLSNNPLIKQKIIISCTDQVMDMPFKIEDLIESINNRLEVINSLEVVN